MRLLVLGVAAAAALAAAYERADDATARGRRLERRDVRANTWGASHANTWGDSRGNTWDHDYDRGCPSQEQERSQRWDGGGDDRTYSDDGRDCYDHGDGGDRWCRAPPAVSHRPPPPPSRLSRSPAPSGRHRPSQAPERSEKPERPSQAPERSEKPERPSQAPERSEKPERPSMSQAPERPSEKPERPSQAPAVSPPLPPQEGECEGACCEGDRWGAGEERTHSLTRPFLPPPPTTTPPARRVRVAVARAAGGHRDEPAVRVGVARARGGAVAVPHDAAR
jgi:hypothetical protein